MESNAGKGGSRTHAESEENEDPQGHEVHPQAPALAAIVDAVWCVDVGNGSLVQGCHCIRVVAAIGRCVFTCHLGLQAGSAAVGRPKPPEGEKTIPQHSRLWIA